MTTLGQGDLPKDPGVLRTAVQEHDGYFGFIKDFGDTPVDRVLLRSQF